MAKKSYQKKKKLGDREFSELQICNLLPINLRNKHVVKVKYKGQTKTGFEWSRELIKIKLIPSVPEIFTSEVRKSEEK